MRQQSNRDLRFLSLQQSLSTGPNQELLLILISSIILDTEPHPIPTVRAIRSRDMPDNHKSRIFNLMTGGVLFVVIIHKLNIHFYL